MFSSRPYSRRPGILRSVAVRSAVLVFVTLAATTVAVPSRLFAQLARSAPAALTDREFWDLFSSASEEGGSFPSENFVSNEQTYQHVIPTLQRTLTPGGVYLGVGPEQNFTYIANLKPRLAVIFDIRRQNAMAHLMYKALFELSPTRADFVTKLFSRPLTRALPSSATPTEIFTALGQAEPSDSAYEANRKAIADHLLGKHGFALTTEDFRSINHVYGTFFEAGPWINYGYRPGSRVAFSTPYPNFGQLQSVTNAAGVNMAFLASEENYRVLRDMHLKNLIVPVVGDFAGPKAIRTVGDYLRERKATVTAFYLSNVEQYLFREYDAAERFYKNVQTLPVDSTSTFIRSVPPGGRMMTYSTAPAFPIASSGASFYSVEVRDSAGLRITTMTMDSAGQRITRRSVDSTGGPGRSPLEIFRGFRTRDDSVARAKADSAMRSAGAWAAPMIVFGRDSIMMGGGGFRIATMAGPPLLSGIAPIRASLDAFDKGELSSYARAIAMTKIDGWN
jgi:hypothetical protein